MTFTKLPKAISAEELLSTPLPPVKWIIPGLLPAGLALFAGPSKAGKSWLTLWLCLQIAQGNPVWNREIEPRTVIYFSLEDTFNRLQNRIFQLIDGRDAPERLILQTECPSIGQGLEEQVESLIHTYCDVGLIVIDTLQKVRVSDGNGGMYANDYKEAGALKKIADKYGICILLIHHLRKQTASDPFDQISGSTGLMGVADTSWVMQRKRMSQTADILLTGRDMDDRTLHLREENCIWTLEDEETAEEREIKAVPDYLWKAAEYIESIGNWQGTASELLAAAGIENAKPNQFTYNMAKYFDKVFEPKNIRYKTHRKNKVRLLSFYGDDGDGGDDDIDITQLSGWGIPERPSPSSPSSLGALEGSKLCREYGLSVVEQPKTKEPARYARMREAIDQACEDASTAEDFHRALYRQGYIFGSDPNRRYATIRARDGGRAVRLYRLGEEYDLTAIDDRLRGNYLLYGSGLYERKHPTRQYTPKRYRPKNHYTGKGILQIFFEVFFGESQMHRLYLYYCYQLGILPKKQQPRINRPELERIWKDTEKILAEHAFVRDHKFPSLQAIVDYRKGLSQRIETFAAQRAEIVKQMRRKDAPQELADRRAMLTCKIAELRKEDKIAEGAIKRIQRTRESNRIDRENQEHHTNHNRRRNRSRQR